MSIQSNINQGLSLMSLLISQTPTAAAVKEERARQSDIAYTKQRLGRAEEAEDIAFKEYEKILENPSITDEGILQSPEYQGYEAAGETVLSIQEELMEKEPTKETFGHITDRRREKMEQREREEEAREKARERLSLEHERISFTPSLETIILGGKK